MGRSATWYGVGITAGGMAIVVGDGTYLMVFVNDAHPEKRMLCLVKGVRGGLALHMGGGLVVGKLDGVTEATQVNGIDGAGFDFALDIGAKYADLIKGGRYAGAAARLLKNYNDFPSLVATVLEDSSKALINHLTGDLSTSNNKPSYAIIGVPGAGTGLGGGAWYEYQKMIAIGAESLWRQANTRWALSRIAGRTFLRVQGMPEVDGTSVIASAFENVDARAPGWLTFAKPEEIAAGVDGNSSRGFLGQVHNFGLWEDGRRQSAVRAGRDGLDLGRYRLAGIKTRSGMVQVPNQRLAIRMSVLTQRDGQSSYRTAWTTKDTIPIRTGSDGQIAEVLSNKPWFN